MSAATKPERLYGLEGAEVLYTSIDEIQSMYPGEQLVVEEWTVANTRSLLPSSELIIELIIDMADPVTEEWWNAAENAAADPDEVPAAFEQAIELLASKINYWMADKLVASHTIEGEAVS